MKIKDIEKFRKELLKNIECVTPVDVYIRDLLKVEFEDQKIRPENRNNCGIRCLLRPLMIEKNHYEAGVKVVDAKVFIKIHQDCMMFFRENTESQSYELIPFTTEYFEDFPTKTSFMIMIGMKIQKFASEGKV